MKFYMNGEDIGQLVIGASTLAVPISFSEEAWSSAVGLPLPNLLLVILLSIGFLALFAYQSLFQARIRNRAAIFIFRIAFAYLLTTVVVAVVLLAIDKLPLLSDPVVAVKRIILITMPASMGAIIVDSFDKE